MIRDLDPVECEQMRAGIHALIDAIWDSALKYKIDYRTSLTSEVLTITRDMDGATGLMYELLNTRTRKELGR